MLLSNPNELDIRPTRLGILGSAVAWPFGARAQQPERVRHIGVVMGLPRTISRTGTQLRTNMLAL
jgi:hypothetical protein